MSSEDEESNPIPSVNDMMDKAKEADAVARAQSSQVAGPMMQSPEEKKKEVEAFELDKPKENKWASGAFKRGLALQVCWVLTALFPWYEIEIRNVSAFSFSWATFTLGSSPEATKSLGSLGVTSSVEGLFSVGRQWHACITLASPSYLLLRSAASKSPHDVLDHVPQRQMQRANSTHD